MTLLFNQITLIGTGLIGGSLALALKERGAVGRVIGCSRRRETLEQAQALGILDDMTVDPAASVAGSGLVVLCTPLHSYAELTRAIAPNLEKNALVTDVGSVKQQPSSDVIKHLPHSLAARFVPGHPIAGTEKSGPSAAVAGLFENKKAVLTPLPITDESAVKQVKTLWEAVGARVELLDVRRHDFIYASVSHAVQFFSSAYLLMVQELGSRTFASIRNHTDLAFQQFIRLGGSDPAMWSDIFLSNRHYLAAVLKDYLQLFDFLKETIMEKDKALLEKRFSNAIRRRERLRELSAKQGVRDASQRVDKRGDYPDALQVRMDLLPRLIACFVTEGVSESEFDYATSSGLRGLTRPILLPGGSAVADIMAHRGRVLEALEEYEAQVRKLSHALEAQDRDALFSLLSQAQGTYRKVTEGFLS